jgi:CxxC-x17-CxxC domain-containing protein
MGNFNRDRDSRDNGRHGFGGGFRGRGGFGRGRGDRQMSSAVCSNCGKNCQVPFKPTGDKPVYCSDCFEKMGNRSERKSFDRPRFGDRKGQDNQFKSQFENLNSKLDRILNLLQPKQVEVPDEVNEPAIVPPSEKPVVKPSKPKKIPKAIASEESEKSSN